MSPPSPQTNCLQYLDARNTPLLDHSAPFVARALRISSSLVVLHLENASLSGRPLMLLGESLESGVGARLGHPQRPSPSPKGGGRDAGCAGQSHGHAGLAGTRSEVSGRSLPACPCPRVAAPVAVAGGRSGVAVPAQPAGSGCKAVLGRPRR